MKRFFKILAAYVKVNLQIDLMYRANLLVNLLVNLMWLGWELLSLGIIFSNTATLGGWEFGHLIALLGVFRMVNMFMMTFIYPNTEEFGSYVKDGSFDYVLLKPVSSLFIVSITRIVVWRAWDQFLGIILLVIGIQQTGMSANQLQVGSFLLLLISGALVIYSLCIALISLTFWFVKFDNSMTILAAVMDAGRYPATIYPPWLRIIVTFLIPIALATTVPMQVLRREVGSWQVLIYFAVGVASFLIAQLIWKLGVRRYSGASS